MINHEDPVLLSDYCFNICEALNATIQGKSADGLNKSAMTALEDLGRCVYRLCLVYLPPKRFDLGLWVKSS